jgi:hypothetical protein
MLSSAVYKVHLSSLHRPFEPDACSSTDSPIFFYVHHRDAPLPFSLRTRGEEPPRPAVAREPIQGSRKRKGAAALDPPHEATGVIR